MPIDYTKRPKTPAAPAPAQLTPTISLSKVTLTKAAPTVSLTKHGSANGLLRVNLNWNAAPAQPGAGGGFFSRMAGPAQIDLDLGALYEYTDGSKGVVQALGNGFADRHSFGGAPIVRLDGDDRSGSNTGGENLFVDLSRTDKIRRVLVFAYIYEGVPNWSQAAAVVTLFPASGPQVEAHLDEADPRARFCAIALLENHGGELQVRRENRFINGSQRDVDLAYGWGLQWSAARK